MGPEFAVIIANKVTDIQSNGEIKAADDTGFRTPGRVFCQFVKKSIKLKLENRYSSL